MLAVMAINLSAAQEIIPDEVDNTKKQMDSTQNGRKKVDGVAAVIGDFVVLDSDIDKEYILLQARGVSIRDITRCQLFGKLIQCTMQYLVGFRRLGLRRVDVLPELEKRVADIDGNHRRWRFRHGVAFTIPEG